MGEQKALLPWGDKCLLEHQVSALQEAGVSRVLVVLGHQAERLEPLLKGWDKVQYVWNPHYRQGKTTSTKVGLRFLDPSEEGAILILNVDQPRSAETICRIIHAHRNSAALITVPTYRGKGGHPTLFSSSLLAELMNISEETLGLKAVVRKYERATQRVEMDSPEVLLDLNTPEDYRQALRLLSSG